jgi:hypothetical protein
MRNGSTYRLAWCAYWLLGVGVAIALLISTVQASQTAPSIIIDISVLHPSNSSQEGIVFITLSNLENVPAESLHLNIESVNGPIANRSLPSLIGGQSQVVPVAIPTSAGDQLVLILQYRQGAVEQSQVKLIELKSSAYGSSFYLNVLLPAILGSVITLIGVLVAAFLAARRESARAKFEWGKFLFEHYEQDYRVFKSRLEGTLNADQINEYFKQLSESAFVPKHLRTKVKEGINVLESDVSIDQKKIARDNLLNEFEQFMENPWGS